MLYTGKRPPTYDARDKTYADLRLALEEAQALPPLPPRFGHAPLFSDWLMLGNGPDDSVYPGFGGCGCCAWSGPAHETMELTKLAGRPVPRFDGATIVRQYSEYSGYDPRTGANDNGSVVRDVLSWRQKRGLVDADGGVHKIGPYVAIEPKNVRDLLECVLLFDCVGIGFEFPASAMDQFNGRRPWTVVPGSPVEGGHYVPAMGRPSSSSVAVITWALRQVASLQFYLRFNDEAWAYVTPERYSAVTGKTFEGYDDAQMQQFLLAVASGPVSS